ncbi:transglutaminase-like domain-containing protein [Methanobrevibacter curvatus]|uniref:transglutaminase-like domain-containing protein n=1 Tax=Methanobrevibacter curvatus TaxID=49547 RepID=UPI00083069B1|nr:transglutaminase-like domain-containing protein [Methanobrevibacter curvatus]
MRAGIFLLTLVFLLSLSFSATSAGNIAVSGDSFDDINDIINTASSGDVIQLGSNTFKSNGSVIRITKENLTFTGASANNPATLSGENISRIAWVNANNITFKYIKFINGNGNTLGGTAILTYSKITVDNCTFSNNAGESGTAIFIYPQASNSVIKNSIFHNNLGNQPGTDNFVQGGAIRSGTTNLTIIDSTFTNNFTLNDGGAISIASGTGTKIINCKFINNSANIGGAIRISDCEVTISNSIFNQNNANSIGGAIFIFNGTATILNSNFTSNKANNGGAIGIYNRTTNDNKIIILKNLIFDSNIATNTGGAIYTQIPIKYLNDSTFKNNYAINGGGIYSLNDLQINTVNFSQNTATTSGGAIYTNGQTSISSKSNFTSNNANNGGAIYALKNLNISNSIFSKNNAISNGGALYINGGTTRILSNSNFSSNNGVNGGVIYSNGVLSIVSANFNDNLATGSGGAIYSLKNLQISSSKFNGNNESNNGGALYLNGGVTTITSKSTFNDNKAINGGGIYTNSNLTINSIEFSSNVVNSNGAGLYINSGTVNILNNSNFTNNKAVNGSGVYSNGKLVVNNALFLNNNASANGGAIYSLNDLSVIATNFNKNNANSNGGALYLNGGITTITSKSIFSNNKAINGGGIYTNSGLTINSIGFSSNIVSSNGAGLYINRGTVNILNNSNFTNNKASSNGGAIFSISSFKIVNSVFSSNSAANGGGIYLSGSSRSTISGNSNFTSNSAKNGGAIYSNSPLAISSTKFSNNKATDNGGAIYSKNALNISSGSITRNTANYGSGICNLATLRISKVDIGSNVAKAISISLKAPTAVKPGKKLTINVYLKTGDNIAGAIYNSKGNTSINGSKKTPSDNTPGKTFSSAIAGSKKNITSNSNGVATRTYTVSKNAKEVNVSVSYSQGGKKWTVSTSVKVSSTAPSTPKTKTYTNKKSISSSSSSSSTGYIKGGSVTVGLSNHEYAHLASLIDISKYKVSFKNISYYNLKKHSSIGVTYYIYKVNKNGWYSGAINSKDGVNWKKIGSKPTTSGTWFNLSSNSKGKYTIRNIVPKYKNNTYNGTLEFFVSVKINISHSSLTPYIAYTYDLVNKKTGSKSVKTFFENTTTDIYFSGLGFSSKLKNELTYSDSRIQVNHSDFKNLAIKIFQGKAGSGSGIEGILSADKKIRAIYEWVKNHVTYHGYRNSHYKSTDVLWRLQNKAKGTANCADQSILLVTFLRTVGVPAYFEHNWAFGGHVVVRAYYTNTGKYILDTTNPKNDVNIIRSTKWNPKTVKIKSYPGYKASKFYAHKTTTNKKNKVSCCLTRR